MKRSFLPIVPIILCVSSLFAAPLEVALGDRPPLFSPSGGRVDLVLAKTFAAEGRELRFVWFPTGRRLTLLEKDRLDTLGRGFSRIKADGTLEKMLVAFFGPENRRRMRIQD